MLCRASIFLFLLALCAPSAVAQKLNPPPEAREGLRLLYSGDPNNAINEFRKIQKAMPESPLGFLLEANARWWKTYCAACEIRWNTIDAWDRKKLPEDDEYLALCDRAIRLAEARIAQKDSAEMRLYAGMGYALKARMHGLRYEKMPTANAGKKARENLLRASQLDPQLGDAYTGLGLYNYYVDALNVFVKVLRFFIGLPGGSKKEGILLLEKAMQTAEYTQVEARLYLAKNLRNYDRQYERSAKLMEPLVDQYPANPVFHLLLGDFYAKLSWNDKAARQFRAARQLSSRDPGCAANVQRVAEQALARLPAPHNSLSAPAAGQ